MKHIHTFKRFLGENANKKITVSLSSSAVGSFKKDLDSNKIPYTVVRPTVFELEDTPKARTAIQEAKSRFGMQSVLVKENLELNTPFQGVNNESFLHEAATPDEYFDYYIAKVDTEVKNPRGKKITIPSGTVIYARGLGRWVSADGKILVGLEVLKGNADFDVVNNSTWPDTVNLVDELEAWGRGTNDLIQKDPKNAQKIIDARAKIIGDIKKMLK